MRTDKLCSLFLVDELFEVKLELLTLKNVTVDAAALAGARGDAGVETAGAKLGLKAVRELSGRGAGRGAGGLADGLRLLTLLTGRHTVVRLEVLAERRSVDLNNGTLGQSVGAHKLVVRRVVDDRDNTGLARETLGTPREVASVQTKSTELLVAASNTHGVDTLAADLSVGRLAAHLELPLLAELSAHGASVRTLVASVTANTHCSFTLGKRDWLSFFVKHGDPREDASQYRHVSGCWEDAQKVFTTLVS